MLISGFLMVFASNLALAADPVAIADGKPLTTLTPAVLQSAARQCIDGMKEAQAWARDVLREEAAWVDFPVVCEVAFEPGCNATPLDGKIGFTSGDSRCNPAASIRDIVYHEWTHGLVHAYVGLTNSSVDEGLADTAAAYISGDPRIGEGFWKGHERSWLRDVSERVRCDLDRGFCQNYTRSLTVSGSWWSFRERMIDLLGAETGAEFARRVLLTHVQVAARAGAGIRSVEEDLGFALSAFELVREQIDAQLQDRAYCELVSAFEEHGYLSKSSGCKFIARENADDQVIGLLKSAKHRVISVSKHWEKPIEAPDMATLTVELNVKQKGKVAAVILDSEIDHLLPDDLMIRIISPDNVAHEIYRGIEEYAVPKRLTDRGMFAATNARGVWRVQIIDQGKDYTALIKLLSLKVIVER